MKIQPTRIPTAKLFASLIAGAALALFAQPAGAQVVNFDVTGGLGGDSYTGQGAYLDAGHNYWNPIVKSGTTSSGLLSDGVTTTPITLTEGEAGDYSGGSSSPQGTPAELEYWYAYANNNSVQTCTLSNIPPGTYNLFLYGKNDNQGDANRGTTFAVTVGTNSFGSQSTTNSVDTSYTLHNDYVEFTNVIVGAGGAVTFTYTANQNVQGNYGVNHEGDFNGLQLVNVTAINFDVAGGVGGINFSGQGAFSNPGLNYWNPIKANGTTSPGTNSDGQSVSLVTFTEAENGDYQGGSPTTQGTVAELEYHFAYANNSSTQTCSLNNVSPGTYTLYLYGKNDNQGDGNRGATFSVTSGGVSYGTQSTTNHVDSVFTLGNDYVVFSGIVVGTNGNITFTYTHNPNAPGTPNNAEGDFNGLQLAQVVLLPPLITAQPQPEVLYAGETAHFSVSGASQPSGPVTVQWIVNGTPLTDGTTGSGSIISGSQTSTLTISHVSAADQLNYQAVLTGADLLTLKSVAVPLTIVTASGTLETTEISENPLHFYQFNDTNDPATTNAVALDYVGGDNGIYGVATQNGNPNYNVSGPTPTQGWPGFPATNGAVAFANGNLNENVAITTPWNLDTNTVTISAWINPNNGAANQKFVFSRGGDTIAGFGYGPNADSSGNPVLGYTWNNDPNTTGWNSGLEVPPNQWSFVALSVTSTNATVSIMNANGLLSATHVYPHPLQSFNGPTLIGDDPADGNGANVFGGVIDNVAVFNQALSFNQLFNVFTNASGTANYGALIGVQPVAQSVYPTQTAQFTVNAGGSGTLNYQWQVDRTGGGTYVNLQNGATGFGSIVSGADSAALSIANVGNADAVSYQVVVTGSFGSPVISTPVALTLLATSSAQNITLSNREPAGQDWNTAANWSDLLSAYDSAAAFPGSTFEVLPGAQLRSVNTNASIAFPGVELTIDGTNAIGLSGELLLNHPAGTTAYSFADLVLAGGRLDNGDDGLATISGAINVSSNVIIASDPIGTAINFDVPGSFAANYVGQGAFSDPGHNYWNALANNGTTANSLLADGTTASPITFTSHEQFTYADGVGTQGQPSGLESAFEGITSSGVEPNNSLNNVPPGTYDLYCYGVNGGNGDHDRGTSFTISSDLTSSRTLSTICTPAGYNQFIEGNDFVVFRNVLVGAGGIIHISYTANPLAGNGHGATPNPPPNTEADFNGVQLVKVTPSLIARSIRVDSALSGTGSIQYISSDTNYQSDLNITDSSNTYSGQWNATQGTLLATGANSLGTNSITVGTNGALETAYDLNDPNAVLFLNGKLFLHQNDTFKSVFLNGAAMSPGTYSAAQLTSLNAAAFPASWALQTGSSVSNSSGSLHVLSSPPPVFSQDISPLSLTIYPSQVAQFSVVAVGSPPVTYAWKFNSTTLSDGKITGIGSVSGSATNTLTISNFTAAAGTYNVQVTVSNPSGSSPSQVATVTILPTSPPMTATLITVQPPGDDWNSSNDWDIDISATQLALQDPGSTNIVPPGTVLNTPFIGTTLAFPGARLIIQGDGNFLNNAGDTAVGGSSTAELRASEPGNVTIFFPDLQFAGGQLDNSGNNTGNANAGQSLGMLTINGQVDILANTTIYSDSGVRGGSLRAINIGAYLTGNGTIQYSAFDTSLTNDLDISGPTNSFSGQWNVLQGALLGSTQNSLGTNSITVATAGALETSYNLNSPQADLVLNGQLFLHQADTFHTVTIAGTALPVGTYSALDLSRAFPANFPLTWPQQIGSSVNNASGTLTILSGPAPAQPAHFAPVVVNDGNLTLSGSGGTPSGSFQLLSSTVLNSVTNANWTVVASGNFDGSGNFSVSLPINTGEAQRFYSIVAP
ncbi:MAG TPA: LamG-like jellyroll fold domain-containing protein [Verrucomicrobiae bacterium]|jgi:hypothetical protein|nr:LamG-like jellyroll fold domain-containing protein [Verrucomicrobiae bacterium]